MVELILRCCNGIPKFLVEYKIGSKYKVCNSCIVLNFWSRGIKKREEIIK